MSTVGMNELCAALPDYFLGQTTSDPAAAATNHAGSNLSSPAGDSNLTSNHTLLVRDPLLESVKYVLAGLVNPALCVFGIVGNVFNVLVLSRRRMKVAMDYTTMEQAAYIGLIALAVSDALYCVSGLADALNSRAQTAFKAEDVAHMYAQLYGPYFQNTFMHTGSWLTVIMAAGRYAAICRPLQARYLLGVRCTLLAVAVTFVVWTLLELPIIWTYEVGRSVLTESQSSFSASIGLTSDLTAPSFKQLLTPFIACKVAEP